MNKEKVRFNVGLKDGVNADDAKRTLEELARAIPGSEVSLKVDSIGRHTYVFGSTRTSTYEKLFDTTLEWYEETVNALVGRPQKAAYWRPTSSPVIPESLQAYVRFVELETPAFPC